MHIFVITLLAILVLIFICQKCFFRESFETKKQNEPLKLYVFVSDHCPHCHTYLNNQHKNIEELCKSLGIEVEKVQSDGTSKSDELFNKYDVKFIPTAVVTKGNKIYKNLGSNITPQTVKKALDN